MISADPRGMQQFELYVSVVLSCKSKDFAGGEQTHFTEHVEIYTQKIMLNIEFLSSNIYMNGQHNLVHNYKANGESSSSYSY